ncbi:MAG: CapA family protein [Bacillota bacterium]|jgi:poly-gamma-glutamate capsule biosynthesis protein CapA/YwtB (metallophosphatase superfamily)
MKKLKQSVKLPLLIAGIILTAALIILIINLADSPKIADQTAEEQSEPQKTEISLLAVGDDLIHGPIYRQAKERGNGAYDFSFAYESIAPYLEGYDFKLINQETPLGGEEMGLSSYPMFNSPTQLGDYLTSIGFNLVSHANNHALDAGEQGLIHTINYWKTQTGVTMAGAYANSEEASTLQIVEKDGVKIAFLAYTYGTNGLSLPSESPVVINYINEDRMKAQIAKAEEAADITLVMMHWGEEYQQQSNEEQQTLAKMMAESDVDIIIGSHPHVIQEVETLQQADGGKCLCFYSLGNFISAQDKPATMLGGMASIKMNYDADNDLINFEKVEFIPIINQFSGGYSNIHIIPLAQYTEQAAAEHGVNGVSYEYFRNLVSNTVDSKYINIR